MPRRGSGFVLGLLLLASLALWLAWLTGHPESPSLDVVARWGPAAPWVDWFREVFGAAKQPTVAPSGSPALPSIVVVPRNPRTFDALPRVWVPQGTVVRDEPRLDAPPTQALEATANLAVAGQRGDWYLVRRPGAAGADGWVHLPGYRDPRTAPAAPEPAAPLPASPPDPRALAAARALMAPGASERDCGGYLLVTDSDLPDQPPLCKRLVAALDEAYVAAFGVEPLGEPAEAILLFAERGAFRRFAREVSGVRVGYAGHARAARGYVALPAGALDVTVRTLVHELTHLVSRRALGPALPRWLAEGLADFLGDGADPDGLGTVHRALGAEGEALRLQGAYGAGLAGPLARLVTLGADEFHGTGPSFDYEQSAFLVRYLLGEPELAPRFRAYLGTLAAGASYDPDAFRQALAVEWAELDRDFERWVRTVYLEPLSARVSLGSG
jgi:hypothetical protein